MTTISFRTLPNTGTREVGREVRSRVLEMIHAGQSVTMDLVNESRITPSFADELFGKLAAELGAQQFETLVKIVNIHSTVAPLIHAAVARRIRQSETLSA